MSQCSSGRNKNPPALAVGSVNEKRCTLIKTAKTKYGGTDLMEFQAKWIQASEETGGVCPVFRKVWKEEKTVESAVIYLTALGVYEAHLNGQRIGKYVLAPGWTAYDKRLQYQQYDITELIKNENELTVTLGKGWFRSPMPGWQDAEDKLQRMSRPGGIFGELHIVYTDGSEEVLVTDESWDWGESKIRFSEIYDGETHDATFETKEWKNVRKFEWPKEILIPQEGEEIREREVVAAKSVFRTPAGELVVDFGQEITGYVEFTVDAREGDRIRILHGEVLDENGNFYNANYRSAKAEINYICREGKQTWHPVLTFFGFRYLLLEQFPGEVKPEQFLGIAVYSNIKKTGSIQTSDKNLNQLISNIFWGQRGNFLDVPTDCPQRDERLGWTGDAQVFVKTATYNFDVERFFTKWLHDLAVDQMEDGAVGHVVPDYLRGGNASAAWADAATICPWQVYQTYGNPQILKDQFESMKKWVDYVTNHTTTKYLWTGGEHFGDWLGLDAPQGSYKGSSREDLIASAFYAHSAELVVKAGHVIGADVTEYEHLHENIVAAFRKTYPEYLTQTEHIVAVQFGLAKDCQKTADALAKMIEEDGCQMRTGFVGTPYILHVLSNYGHTDLAYRLLCRKEYPSWLYAVGKGATTIWEHWDGIMENGEFWSTDMNSFNHYAYGSVADWMYEQAAGIQVVEDCPGFAKARIAPRPGSQLKWMEASIETRHGKISSRWVHEEGEIRYEISTAVPAEIVIGRKRYEVDPGDYVFWE